MKGRKPSRPPASGAGSRVPRPPAWLAPIARAEWRRVAPILAVKGILTPEAQPLLASYVTAVAQVREAEDLMLKEGRVILNASGRTVHPAFRVQQAALRELRLLAAELRISPYRQTRADDAEPADQDDDLGLD